MSEEYPSVEQDATGFRENELPTYDDLAVEHGPNSRFGRWRGWIEKRAAERYNDITDEERARRRERGWDLLPLSSFPMITREPPTPALHIQTTFDHQPVPVEYLPPGPDTSPSPAPIPFISQPLPPTHLKVHHFGSRFLPHTTAPIRCVLPLLGDTLLLIGHDDGLSVLDMFPQEWGENGQLIRKSPNDAEARLIWQGEGVYQMSVLEVENGGDGKTHGVVLCLVGPSSDLSCKDSESTRSLRMYNLASLISLAQWGVAQKGARPLDMNRPSNWQAQQAIKKHRHHSSIARNLKNLIDNSHGHNNSLEPSTSSYQSLLSPASSSPNRHKPLPTPPNGRLSPVRGDHDENAWDVVDDLPLRWATDFVPLASPGSRLSNISVLSFAIWPEEPRQGRGGQMLAIATKSNILLYETPKGERAFRFVKDFYTPLQPRSISFFHQAVQNLNRNATQIHRQDTSPGGRKRTTSLGTPSVIQYTAQLSLFVAFSSKKAGSIRLLDAAVGEMDLYDDGMNSPSQPRDSLSPVSGRRSLSLRSSFDGLANAHLSNRWILPVHCTLPSHNAGSKPVCLLTKGHTTHVLLHPLPANISLHPPLQVINWSFPPLNLTVRVWDPAVAGSSPFDPEAYMQVTAFGEEGIETQEIPLSNLGKGKGRARKPLRAADELVGSTGFLCAGGLWDNNDSGVHPSALQRSYSTSTTDTYDSVETEDLQARQQSQRGVYGWCQKSLADYRVFWVGGSLSGHVAIEDDT